MAEGGRGLIQGPSLPSVVALEDVLRKGREALAAGHIDGALRTFNAALRIKPTYAPAWQAKGRALRAAGDPKAALACYAEALRHDAEDEASWFGLALTFHALGRRSDEVVAYDELLRRNPRSAAAWMNRGVALHEDGRFAQALTCFDRTLAMRPEMAAAWSNRGAALLRLRRFEDALAAFDEALALDSSFADAAANRRAALSKLGRAEPEPLGIEILRSVPIPQGLQARALANLGLPSLELWRRSPPRTGDDFLAFGTALLDAGNPQAAVSSFGKAEGLGAGPVAGVGKLLALQVLGGPGLQEEASRLWAASPHEFRLGVTVARVREVGGDVDGAIAVLATLVEDRPDAAWAWSWKGILELKAGRPADARMSFEAATAADPDDGEAWANLGAALHLAGDAAAGLAACERALSVDPGLAAAENNRAVILATLGRGSDAEAGLKRAAKGSDEVTFALNRAALAEAEGRNRAAADLYETIRASAPKERLAVAGLRRAEGQLAERARRRKRTGRKRATKRRKR